MSTDQTLNKAANQLAAEGQKFPVVTLKDGSKVQTGTLGSMLSNIKRYNAGEKGDDVVEELRAAIPTAVRVGLFDLFSPSEWHSDSDPGRNLVGRLAEEHQKQRPKT